MAITIFYSWQSDSPGRVNKDLIQVAAERAIGRIVTSEEFRFAPVIDRDTEGTPGLPGIAQTIFEKIDRCSLFLADVSIVSEPAARRPTPNPNVLVELGYAAARKGWERIVCVMNEEFGGPTKLPFDLRHRRWPIRYRLSNSSVSEKRDEELARLSQAIELAVRGAAESGILLNAINSKDRRVALKYRNALMRLYSVLPSFLEQCGLDHGLKVLLEDHEDAPGSQYPDPALVQPIVDAFSKHTLKGASNLTIGGRQASWAESFILALQEVQSECDRILDQYADREESLVSLIDEMAERCRTLRSMLQISLSTELAYLYDSGVPENHLDWFRYFLLLFVKSFRVIRSLGVETE